MRNVIVGSAVLGIILLAGAGTPTWAQEEVKTETVEEHVVIKRVGKDGKVAGHPRRIALAHAKCAGEKAESDISVGEGRDKQRTRIVVCGNGESSAELDRKLVEALEKARSHVGRHDEMSAERRAELLAKIESEIARVRARN